jgi:hypothetical protein
MKSDELIEGGRSHVSWSRVSEVTVPGNQHLSSAPITRTLPKRTRIQTHNNATT